MDMSVGLVDEIASASAKWSSIDSERGDWLTYACGSNSLTVGRLRHHLGERLLVSAENRSDRSLGLSETNARSVDLNTEATFLWRSVCGCSQHCD